MLSASSMNIGNSNIGVHGVEDLGGGWKTGFDIETALDLRDGSPRGSGGGFWGRRANMWVSGPAGSLRLGRSYNLATWGMWVWELTGEATYAVTPGTFGYLDSFTARSNSLITYVTPRLGDFQAGLAYVFGADNDPKDLGRRRIDSFATYEHGPLKIGLTVNQTAGRKPNGQIGMRYEFSRYAISASWNDVRHIRERGIDGRRKGFSLGGQLRLTPFVATLEATRDVTNEWSGGKKYTNVLAEARYLLSKRTLLYSAYLRYDGANNYIFGVRHKF